MTDTQEAMREEFEAWWHSNVRDVTNPISPRKAWYAATARSAETVAMLRRELVEQRKAWQTITAQSAEKMARLEAENKELRAWKEKMQDGSRLCIENAAAELSNKQFCKVLQQYLDNYGRYDFNKNLFASHVRQVLAQQPSTEALDAYVNDEIKRRQYAAKRFNGCLPQFKGDTMHPPTPELAPINQDEPYHEQR